MLPISLVISRVALVLSRLSDPKMERCVMQRLSIVTTETVLLHLVAHLLRTHDGESGVQLAKAEQMRLQTAP